VLDTCTQYNSESSYTLFTSTPSTPLSFSHIVNCRVSATTAYQSRVTGDAPTDVQSFLSVIRSLPCVKQAAAIDGCHWVMSTLPPYT